MRKIILISVALVLSAVLFICTGCAKKLDEPVFLKSLVCAEDMDAEVKYITNKDWDKDIVGISIHDSREDISINLYDEETEKIDGYLLHTVNFGISGKLNSDYGLAEPFTITEIQVTWDDGTTYMADVGTITMRSLPEDMTYAYSETREPINDERMQVSQGFIFEQDVDIVGIDIPYVKQMSKILSDVTINDVPVSKISKDNPLHVRRGEECILSYVSIDENKTDYGTVSAEISLIGIKDGKEQPVGVCGFMQHGAHDDIERFLK